MRTRIGWAPLIALMLLAAPLWAEPTYTKVDASDTNVTTTYTVFVKSIHVRNGGADEAYIRLFTTEDTAAAATTSHYPLPAGAAITFTHNTQSEVGLGYGAISIICDTGETAQYVHLLAK